MKTRLADDTAAQSMGDRLVRNVRSLIFGEAGEERPRRRTPSSRKRSARGAKSRSRTQARAGARATERSVGSSKPRTARGRNASRVRRSAKQEKRKGRGTRRRRTAP